MNTKKFTLPPELKVKISTGLAVMIGEHGAFLTIFGFGFAILMLFGPIVGPPDHNLFRYLFHNSSL